MPAVPSSSEQSAQSADRSALPVTARDAPFALHRLPDSPANPIIAGAFLAQEPHSDSAGFLPLCR